MCNMGIVRRVLAVACVLETTGSNGPKETPCERQGYLLSYSTLTSVTYPPPSSRSIKFCTSSCGPEQGTPNPGSTTISRKKWHSFVEQAHLLHDPLVHEYPLALIDDGKTLVVIRPLLPNIEYRTSSAESRSCENTERKGSRKRRYHIYLL